MKRASPILIGIALISAAAAHGQTAADVAFILDCRAPTGQLDRVDSRRAPASASELKMAASGLIRLYQVVLSSQDLPSCRFEPSCSNFTKEAIWRGGFVRGSLLGADRLMRCHCLTKPQLHLDDSNARRAGRLYDPVDSYLGAK